MPEQWCIYNYVLGGWLLAEPEMAQRLLEKLSPDSPFSGILRIDDGARLDVTAKPIPRTTAELPTAEQLEQAAAPTAPAQPPGEWWCWTEAKGWKKIAPAKVPLLFLTMSQHPESFIGVKLEHRPW
jgi:hypothetical protein